MPQIVRRILGWGARHRYGVVLGGAALLGLLAGVLLQVGRAPPKMPMTPPGVTLTIPAAQSLDVREGRFAIGWLGSDGAAYRGAVDARAYRDFVTNDRARAAADTSRLTAQAQARVHDAMVPPFVDVGARVPAFGAWTFDWWTSWILLGRVMRWMWDEVSSGYWLAMPERVQVRLVSDVEQEFQAIVLQPETLEPQLAAALAPGLAATRAELEALCRRHEIDVSAFVAAATPVERRDAAGRWAAAVPADAAAALTLGCTIDGRSSDGQLRAEIARLHERGHLDDPVNEVIVRMARPFATKLISFVVLPAIVAGLIGAFALPLLGILPNIFASVAAGLLTGALGAGIIGFSASASVDWLLTRADELRNRAGFEVQVRRAVTARRDTLEAAIVRVHTQMIERQLRPFGETH
jgi:hypothetical protein